MVFGKKIVNDSSVCYYKTKKLLYLLYHEFFTHLNLTTYHLIRITLKSNKIKTDARIGLFLLLGCDMHGNAFQLYSRMYLILAHCTLTSCYLISYELPLDESYFDLIDIYELFDCYICCRSRN